MPAKKKKEPKKKYIMVDEHTGEYRVADTKKDLEAQIEDVIRDTNEDGYITVFEGVELDWDVEHNPAVAIREKKN